jgi:uncharacterized protein with FMN-binding domain
MNQPKQRKGFRKMGIALLVIVGLIVTGLAGGILMDAPGRREAADLVIQPVDFNRFRDGSYTGEFVGVKSHARDTKVEVTISGGQITDIAILKGAVDKNGKPAQMNGGKTMDDLFGQVLKTKSLQVDVVSGATLTSKTHLKALENALELAEAN